MKNTILFILMLLLLSVNSYSFEKINTIDLKKLDYSDFNQLRINFKHNGKNVATHSAIELNEILKLNRNEFAVFYYENGESSVYSYYDLINVNNQNPLLLIENKNVSSLGDTLVIGEDELLKLESNLLLEKELNSVLDVQYQLNLKKITPKDKNKYFKPSSIIYPFDNSIIRWKSKVEKIIIYRNS